MGAINEGPGKELPTTAADAATTGVETAVVTDEIKDEEVVSEEVEGVINMTPVKEGVAPELTPEEIEQNKVLANADAIRAERMAKQNAEEAAAFAALESVFGLDRDMLEACRKAEMHISDPKNGILTLIEALKYYESCNFTVSQLGFMAINSNSRANMLRSEVDKLRMKVSQSMGQVEGLMKAVKTVKVVGPGEISEE